MKRVLGMGGVFFKADDPKALKKWYETHLGIEPDADGYVSFHLRDEANLERKASMVWEAFASDTKYFQPSDKPYMFNYRVADLDGLLAVLKEEGIEQCGEIEDEGYGRFAWIMDPEGNKIELWEPPPSEGE